MRGKRGQVQIDVPRDRNSEFEPQLVKKGQTRFDGLALRPRHDAARDTRAPRGNLRRRDFPLVDFHRH
jgi:hypothetical protein